MAVLLGLCLLALPAIPAQASAQTVVSLTFDDGIASQYNVGRPQLAAHGMLGTFYINSGRVGTDPYYMGWPQIDTLNAERNEIGGHTINHVRLSGSPTSMPPPVTPAEARRQICEDAATLRSRGYQVLDFAYPFGAGATDTNVRTALHDCGFVSARRYGNLRGPDCTSTAGGCPIAETILPNDPYAVNSTGSQTGPLTLTQLQKWVTQAEGAGGGWVPIVFHEIDNSGQPNTVTPATFIAFLDWLAPRAASGTIVKTVRSVMGYPDPELPKPAPPPPAAPAVAPDKVTTFAKLKARASQHVADLYVTASMGEPGTLSAGGVVSVPGASKVYRFKTARKNAVPGVVVKLRLKLTKKGLRAVKRALRRHKRLKAKLTIKATDRAGNVKLEKRTVRLLR